MFGRRKINAEESVTEKRTPEKGQIKQYLDALSFLSSFVMDKKDALVEEELKRSGRSIRSRIPIPRLSSTMRRSAMRWMLFRVNSRGSEGSPVSLTR